MVLFTKAALALHNNLKSEDAATYCPTGFLDEEDSSGNVIREAWREEQAPPGIQLIGSVCGNW